MRRSPTTSLMRAVLVLALSTPATACAQTAGQSIQGTGQGQVAFQTSGIGELSGITYLGGDQYALVSDTNGQLATATISIDRASGQITGTQLLEIVSISGGSDLEGIAYDPRDGTVLISDESGNTITRHALDSGFAVGSLPVPSVYLSAASNRGLESLSMETQSFTLWTANEEALTVDGPASTATQGTAVRLQRFDASGQPDVQYAYRTEPHLGDILNFSQSGVSDLVALPNGGLIVMERQVGGNLLSPFTNRLFFIDPSQATETSRVGSLMGFNDGLVEKTLLLDFSAGVTNFEGITLGPMLSNGDYALLLVSDDGSVSVINPPQNLVALRLSGLAVQGDLTGDFVVDADDLAVVLNRWGDTVAAGDRLAGDLSGDGGVGVADLDLVLENWSDLPSDTVVVPEPGGASGVAAVIWAFASRRW